MAQRVPEEDELLVGQFEGGSTHVSRLGLITAFCVLVGRRGPDTAPPVPNLRRRQYFQSNFLTLSPRAASAFRASISWWGICAAMAPPRNAAAQEVPRHDT